MSRFKNREEFTSQQSSEKITLAHFNAKKRLYTWQDDGTSYSRSTDFFVYELHNELQQITQVNDLGSLVDDSFFYDIKGGTLHVRLAGNADPSQFEMIVTFRLFFGSKSVSLPHDLADISTDVFWDGRIQFSPGYKHKIGIDQALTSLIGEGTMTLFNNDGGLDGVFDKLIFENQECTIYSWNPHLKPSETRVIWRGRVTNKFYNNTQVKFKIKDQLYNLLDSPQLDPYTEADNVSDASLGQYKRRIYGRVDGLRCQSVDQIGDGIPISGTFSNDAKPSIAEAIQEIREPDPEFNPGVFDTDRVRVSDFTLFNIGDIVIVGGGEGDSGYEDTISGLETITIIDPENPFDPPTFEYFIVFTEGWAGANPVPTESQEIIRRNRMIGTGTSFRTDLKQGDKIQIDTQEFTVDLILSDTLLYTTSDPDFGFTNRPGILTPEGGISTYNRRFQAAGHACAEVTHNIVNVLQFNRLILDDTSGLFGGDFLEIVQTSERLEIKNIAPGNIVVLQQNMITKPTNGTTVKRQPIQEVYVRDRRVNSDDYTIDNTTAGCFLVLDSNVEFNLARGRNSGLSFEFFNGATSVSLTTADASITEVLSPGDFIKPNLVTYDTYYKIIAIDEDSQLVYLSTTFAEPTVTALGQFKRPDLVQDTTIVSTNILGATVDGEVDGTWIKTVAQAQRDLLSRINLTAVNEQSFIDGGATASQLVSMAVPLNFSDKKIPTVKNLVDLLNKSVRSSLTLDNNLDIKYQTLLAFTQEDMVTVYDRDVVEWSINTVSGKTYQTVNSSYRFTDVDLNTQEDGNKFFSDFSEYVDKYIGTSQVDDRELYIYEENDAKCDTHRHLYYNRLGFSTLKLTTDLRLENVEIGQPIIVAFDRLYQRFGSDTFRYKVMMVIGKTLSAEQTSLELSDLGNVFNTSSIITVNAAPGYAAATEVERLVNGFITDDNGITEDNEDTAGIHLIS